MRQRRIAAWAAALTGLALAAPAGAVTRQETTVNGLKVYRLVWTDSKGYGRTLSLKKQGEGNSGNGGYAVQMTYKYKVGSTVKTATINAPNGDGFGYFVSHERYRAFSDGDSDTIAHKIFKKDDSPLGRGFPVATRVVSTGPKKGVIQYKLNYPRYGTIAAGGIDQNTGEDKPKLGTSAALYKLYQLAVTINWYVQDGRDYPRIVTRVDMSGLPGPDRASFDVRGPYGKLDFDVGSHPISQLLWGDRYQFKTTSALTRNSTWVYNASNTAYSRYSSMIANSTFEWGLLEPLRFSKTATNDGYSEARGQTSSTYNGGDGCAFQDQKLPCDYEWPYQSSQYELPYDDPNGRTTSEKMAWGSTPFYGMSIGSTYDGTTAVPFDGFPSGKYIQYHVCLVVGQAVSGGLTRTTAMAGGTYNCADTALE